MKLNQSAFFQGKFRVILCESNFEGGIFQQILTMTRFREQDNDIKMTGFKDIAGEIIGGGVGTLSRTDAIAVMTSSEAYTSTPNVVKKVKSAYNGIGDNQRSYQFKNVSKRLNFTGR